MFLSIFSQAYLRWQSVACALLLIFFLTPFQNHIRAQDQAFEQDATYRDPVESDGQLIWQFESGRKFEIVTQQSMTMKMDLGAQQLTSVTNNATQTTWHIQNIDSEGLAKSEMTIDRMTMKLDNNGTVIKYDSDSDSDSDEAQEGLLADLAASLDVIIGRSISYKVSPQGRVSDVQVPDDMFGENQNAALLSIMNPQTIAELTKNSTLFFPNPRPQIGDVWEDSSVIDMDMFEVTSRVQYQYLGVEDQPAGPVHVIGITIDQNFSDSGGVEVEIVSQESNSKVYFDGIKGYLVGSHLAQDIRMNISVAGQVIDQQIQQQTQVKVTAK